MINTRNSLVKISLVKKFVRQLGGYLTYLRKILKDGDNTKPESFIFIEHDARQVKKLIRENDLKNPNLVVFCGIGGAILGIESFYFALNHKLKPALFFDTLDQEKNQIQIEILKKYKNKKIVLIYSSKSATTFETNFNFLKIQEILKNKAKCVFISDSKEAVVKNLKLNQRKISQGLFLRTNENIGGRFSQFDWLTPVCLEILGADSAKIIAGSQKAAQNLNQATIWASQIFVNYLAGKEILVNVFANENLYFLAKFLSQLYAESLGKKNKGIFPAFAFVTSDFHSLLQNFVAGKNNKLLNFINFATGENDFNQKQKILIDSVKKMLALKKRSFSETNFEKLDEENLAYLMMQKMIEILLLAKLLKINPFNQPDIELYKKIARKYFNPNLN